MQFLLFNRGLRPRQKGICRALWALTFLFVSCSPCSQLFASLTVAKKPLQLQAKPAVKRNLTTRSVTMNDSE